MRKATVVRFLGEVGLVLLFGINQIGAQSNQTIYADSLSSGWVDWSWATVNLANTSPVHGGSRSISVTEGAWTGLFFHCNTAFDPAGYTNLTFYINGGSAGGQLLKLQMLSGNTVIGGEVDIPALAKNTWQQINAPFSILIAPGQTSVDGFWLADRTGTAQPVFYVDDIVLQAGPVPPPVTNAPVTVTVDMAVNRHPISPLIYGTAFASAADLTELNFTMNRSGGNAETRYNWQINAHNRANDWYYESIADDTGSTPGASADDHITASKNGGAEALITIPMIEWMPKLGPGRGKLASFSIAKYGPQTDSDQWMPDAGNGVSSTGGTNIVNDPNDADFPTNSAFQQTYVQHLISRWGASTNGGVRYYIMDNEHSIWHSTHRDVHPVGASMEEIRNKMFDYAGMVKSNDPNALVLGPEEFGWSGYLNSGYDLWYTGLHGYSLWPDRSAHGNLDYMPWLLGQFYQRATNTQQRLLDYFTLHCYPEDNNVAGNATDTATQLLRNRLTRKFWDTNYVDETWIGQQTPPYNIVKLIPRMKGWVNGYYPGTKIGITEYNWGAESHINGATAQADILGIFGREGLDLATRWATPATNTPTYLAMKMYRNYDGSKSAFGDTSVTAAAPNPDNLSAFAAIRTNDGALTIMVVNKTLAGQTPLTLNVTNFAGSGTARAWQLTASNAITRLADIPVAGGVVASQLPAQSITLLVLAPAAPFSLRVGTMASAGQFTLWLDGQAGQKYILQSSSNLVNWLPASTNTLSSNSFPFTITTTGSSPKFYRGLLNSP